MVARGSLKPYYAITALSLVAFLLLVTLLLIPGGNLSPLDPFSIRLRSSSLSCDCGACRALLVRHHVPAPATCEPSTCTLCHALLQHEVDVLTHGAPSTPASSAVSVKTSEPAAVAPPMTLPAALTRISVLERLSRNAAQLANVVLDDGLSFTHFDATVCGFPLRLVESAGSITSSIVVEELNKGSYPLADIAALVKPGAIILDLGTNVGITAIVLAKLYPHARVVGVEPAPPNFAAAVANVRENGVADRVALVNAALATAGDLTMHFSVQNPGASSLSKEFFDLGAMQDLGSRTYTVASVSLDELLDFAGVGPGDVVPFVKLDCEGCEYDIVPAASARAKALLRSAVVAGETHADRMPSVPAAVVTDTHSYYSMYSAVGSTPAKLWQPPPDLAAANAALGKTRALV